MLKNQSFILGSAFYLFFFGAAGAVVPYLTIYYQSRDISKQDIGYLVAIGTLISIIMSPIWSGFADALRLRKLILIGVTIGTLPAAFLLMKVNTLGAVMLAMALFYFFLSPIISLADSAILSSLSDRDNYGQLRLWGAVGWGLIAWIAGIIAEAYTLNLIFLIYILLMAVNLLVIFRLPVPEQEEGDSSYFADLKQLLGNSQWLGFLATVFMAGMVLAIFNNYFPLYLIELGAGESLFGVSVAIASVSEIPVFFLSPRILKRMGPGSLLYMSFAALMLRGLLYAIIDDPYLMLFVQLLHGLSFAGMWTAAVVYVNKIAPERLSATAQSALGTISFGVAGAVGALVGANIYEGAGPVMLFRVAAMIAVGAMLVFTMTRRVHVRRETIMVGESGSK